MLWLKKNWNHDHTFLANAICCNNVSLQEYNQVGDAGAIDLARGLSANTSLQYLFLVRYEPMSHLHLLSAPLALSVLLCRRVRGNAVVVNACHAATKQRVAQRHLQHRLQPCVQQQCR